MQRCVLGRARIRWHSVTDRYRMSAHKQEGMDKRLSSSNLRIILGSESASRKWIMDDLARQHQFSYETMKASIDESALGDRSSTPEDLVLLLAQAKADAIVKRHGLKEGLLLTCDQVVLHNRKILEKPHNADEARRFIRGYSGSSAQTVGSVLCTNLLHGTSSSKLDIAEVSFGEISESIIDTLVKEDMTYKCAGGLMIEHPLVAPLITITVGTEDSIQGLSKNSVIELLLAQVNKL